MNLMAGKRNPDRDERVKLPLDAETALRALLAVNPDSEPAGDQAAQDNEPGQRGDTDHEDAG